MITNAQTEISRLVWGKATPSQIKRIWASEFAGKEGAFTGQLVDAKDEGNRLTVQLVHWIDKNRLNVPRVFLEAVWAENSASPTLMRKILQSKQGDTVCIRCIFSSEFPEFSKGVVDTYYVGVIGLEAEASLLTGTRKKWIYVGLGVLFFAGLIASVILE